MQNLRTKIVISIIFFFVAVIFFCLNSFVPYYDDDVWYALRYVPGESISPITQPLDILVSQYHHYMGENSRAIIHITLQSLLAVLPEIGFDLINTIVFLLLIYLMTSYVQREEQPLQPLPLLLTICGIYGLLPDMDYLFYWAAGSLNYLWTSVATLIFFHMWRKGITSYDKVTAHTWIYATIALGCAFSHEAFALPVGGSLLIYMLVNHRHIGYNHRTIVALAYGIGCLAILIAPGMENKTEHIGYDSPQHYVQQLIITIRNLRVIPLCVTVACLSCCYTGGRKALITFIRDNRYLLLVALLAFIMVASVRAGAYTMRIFYAAEFFALLLLLRYCNLLLTALSLRWQHILSTGLGGIMILWCIMILPAAHRTGVEHHRLLTHDEGVIFLAQENTPPPAQRWIMNLHKYYYATPEAEWRAFVIPLRELKDRLPVPTPLLARDSCMNYQLHNKYILILPHDIQPAIENPDEFFTSAHKVSGNNPFFITSDSCYIIAPLDSMQCGNTWQWHYYPASWHEPSASLSGFIRRLVAPSSFPLTSPVEYPDTITLPDHRRFVIYARPPYRTLQGIEPCLTQ